MMTYKSKRIAVIGAGVSGVTTAKHLKASGIDVVVYERSSGCGGVWAYDERRPPEPTFPATHPSIADFVAEDGEELPEVENVNGNGIGNGVNGHLLKEVEDIERQHAPPGPAYSSLKNNIPTSLQELKGHPWPQNTPDFINVREVGEYIHSYVRKFDVEEVTKYDTRVEKLEKVGKKWRVESSTLIREGEERGKKVREVEEFDGVVVASGHYHASKVPDIPGLKEWKTVWPDRVQHSKGYRKPDDFKDQNVLIIGAGVSSTDIAKEISPLANSIYQSSRGGTYDLPARLLPSNTERVTEVASFELPTPGQTSPGSIALVDGRVLTGIDRVLFGTGYHVSLPFLPDLHEDFTPVGKASETVLITDGTQVHNLHKDIFYIPDPTLAFVGVPYYVATFTLFEFQAIAVAAVFSGRAWLSEKEEMRREYRERVERKGVGRSFHSLLGEEALYVRELVEWVNGNAEVTGGEKVEGHSEKWLAESEVMLAKFRKMLESK